MLIIPTPNEAVTFSIPTTQDVGERNLWLTVTDSTRHEVYDGDVGAENVTPYMVTLEDFTFGLPIGQYTYELYAYDDDSDVMVGSGVLQCGLTPAESVEYQTEQQTYIYEG